jgi:transposase
LNANQVFKWRRAFERDELVEAGAASTALLPVTLTASSGPAPDQPEPPPHEVPASGGAIHIELPGRAAISVESGADASLLRAILESLRK